MGTGVTLVVWPPETLRDSRSEVEGQKNNLNTASILNLSAARK
jgi:hypothetical protein